MIHGLGPGGAEQVLFDLCGALPSVGVDVSVLSLMPLDGHAYPAELRERGVQVSTLALPSRWDVRGLRRAVATIAQTAPDVVHTHMKHADFLGAVAARRLGVPLVSTLHMLEDAPTPLGRLKRALAAQARLRAASRTVAVSDAVRGWYLSQFTPATESVVTIRNGRAAPEALSAEARRAARAQLGISESTVAAVAVGIMRPGKGHAAVLEAARRIKGQRQPDAPRVCFLLAGDGPLRPQLEDEARRSGVAGDVRFLGYRDDIPTLLQASDLLVHTSDFDALPTALIEGLAAGLPSVAFAVGGVPEIITPDTGYLLEHGDVDGLAAAIERLAGDAETRRRMGRDAKLRFVAEFDALRWAGRLRDLYSQVMAEARVKAQP